MMGNDKLSRKERKIAKKEQKSQILADWKEEKDAKKEEKSVRKKERKEKKALMKQRRKARPIWQRMLCFLGKIVVVLVFLCIVFFLLGGMEGLCTLFRPIITDMYMEAGYKEPNLEAERELIPADEDAQKRIAKMKGYSKDDTWAIYVYMVGSNLESDEQNDLSDMMNTISSLKREENKEKKKADVLEMVKNYSDTISSAGLELPGPMYYADPPQEASSEPVTNDVKVSTRTGVASMDIEEIREVALPDNIKFVVQTGGATHWSNPLVNPNRVQTFELSKDNIKEVKSEPLHSMATEDSLTDFLSFCDKKYDADHKVLILWNHGAGAFGYGHDEIHNEILSINNIKNAMSEVYSADDSNPPFELIGYDACLMSMVEVLENLDGFGKYFVGSEESEPGFGWYYTPWVQALCDNPGMNGAQLGLAIADSYMDFYARIENNIPIVGGASSVTMSVIDVHKGARVGKLYNSLMKTVLKKSCDDPSIIAKTSQAAANSIHYAGENYEIFNSVDLGLFMDNMPKEVQKKADAVQKAIDDAVLYVRSDDTLKGSSGIAVYFPNYVTSYTSVYYLMDYITNVSSEEVLKILYFYKAAGCLTPEMEEYMEENNLGKLDNIDLTYLNKVSNTPIKVSEDGNISLKVSKTAQAMMQQKAMAIGKIEDDTIVYYGSDALVGIDDKGYLNTDFNGAWLSLNNSLLEVNVIYENSNTIAYSAPILLNGEKAKIYFSYNKSEDKFTIQGSCAEQEIETVDSLGRNTTEIMPGSKIIPLHRTTDMSGVQTEDDKGKAVYYDANTVIKRHALDEGKYISMVSYSSTRGDEFTTGIAEFTMKNDEVVSAKVNKEFTVIMSE